MWKSLKIGKSIKYNEFYEFWLDSTAMVLLLLASCALGVNTNDQFDYYLVIF